MKVRKRRNLEVIIANIKQYRKINDTNIVLENAGTDWVAVLASAISTPDGYSVQQLARAVHSSVFDRGLKLDFTVAELSSSINRKLTEEANRQKEKFYFFYFLTGLKEPVFRRSNSTFATANFAPSKTSRFYSKATSERARLREQVNRDHPTNPFCIPDEDSGLPVIVSATGVSHLDAYTNASDLLDFERGLLNFLNNHSTRRRWTSPPAPVNRFLVKPFTTPHLSNGRLVSDNFWFESDWTLNDIRVVEPERIKSIGNEATKIKVRLRSNPLRSDAADMIRQYCRVFDTTDYRDSFLRAWALLERLTVSSGDYEKLVKRASKVWLDEANFREIAQYLRQKRNESVHSHSYHDTPNEEIVYLSKQLIDPLLNIYLKNSFDFQSSNEVAEFLDLPSSKAELRRRKKMFENGLVFRST